jgi:hypothetical protein
MTTRLGHLDALAIQIQATMALHHSQFPTEGLTAVADDFLEQLKREVEAEEARKLAEAQAAAAAASKKLMDSLVKDVKDGGGKQG